MLDRSRHHNPQCIKPLDLQIVNITSCICCHHNIFWALIVQFTSLISDWAVIMCTSIICC
jgi:hypothetical protein